MAGVASAFHCSGMTYDLTWPAQELSHDVADEALRTKASSISRASSLDSIMEEVPLKAFYSSDELDKLSSCLSESVANVAALIIALGNKERPLQAVVFLVCYAIKHTFPTIGPARWRDEVTHASSDTGKEFSTSVFYDVVQALVALWTCVVSLLYSYAWRQHRKKFIMSIFFVVPAVFTVCCVISGMLATMVVLGRMFSSPIAYKDFLNMREKMLSRQDSMDCGRRQRSYSGTSSVSVTSEDYLPKPLCRRHSASHNSLCSRPVSAARKYSYAYSHYNADEDEQN